MTPSVRDLAFARGAGVTTTYGYHPGTTRLASVSRPLVGTASVARWQYLYDDAQHPGDLTRVVDPRQKTSTFGYHPVTGDATSARDPRNHLAETHYDASGRPDWSVSARGTVAGADPAPRRSRRHLRAACVYKPTS